MTAEGTFANRASLEGFHPTKPQTPLPGSRAGRLAGRDQENGRPSMITGSKYTEGDVRDIRDCSNKETNTFENRVNFGTTNRVRTPGLGKTKSTLARRAVSISDSGPWGGKPPL